VCQHSPVEVVESYFRVSLCARSVPLVLVYGATEGHLRSRYSIGELVLQLLLNDRVPEECNVLGGGE